MKSSNLLEAERGEKEKNKLRPTGDSARSKPADTESLELETTFAEKED